MKKDKEYKYIVNRSFEEFKEFYEKNPFDINKKYYGATGLMNAISNKREKIALFFLEKNTDLTLKNNKGGTALHYTIIYNMYEVSKKILKINPDLINIVDDFGFNALNMVSHYDGGRGGKMFKLILSYCDDEKKNILLKMAKGKKYDKVIKLIKSSYKK